jgi:hypothetical protein
MSNSLYKENGYYSILKESFNNNNNDLQTPVNIYNLESNVMQNVDIFQQKYARFLKCSSSEKGIVDSTSPSCDMNNDGINSLNASYQNVMYSINALNNGLKNIDSADSSGLTNGEYAKSKEDVKNTYQEILSLRKQLDTKLAALYNEQKNGRESSTAQLDSTMYANTLWTILATCLLYYIIVEL